MKKFKDVNVGDFVYILDINNYSELKNVMIYKIEPVKAPKVYGLKKYYYKSVEAPILHKGEMYVFFKDRKYDYVSSKGFLFFTENEGRENYMKQYPEITD
jgi:hypothetical protein